jgi:Ca2+-binding EF-hand superfamily protein
MAPRSNASLKLTAGFAAAAVVALAAGAAPAQTAPAPGDPDAPTATARQVTRPAPADAPPLPVVAADPSQTAQAAPGAQVEVANDPIPTPRRQQLFISPMGEPFRTDFGRPYPVEAWFANADRGHKGYLTLDDFREDAKRFFKVVDENGDGVIDGFEVGDYETKIAPEILPQVQDRLAAQDVLTDQELRKAGDHKRKVDQGGDVRKARGGKLTDAMTGAAQYGLLAEPEPVRGSDGNLDFRITKDEWMDAARRRFDELDKKHDGKLTLDELPHTPMQQMLEDRAKREAKAAAKEKKS